MDFVPLIFKKDITLTRLLGLLCFVFMTTATYAKEKEIKKILVWGDSLSAAYGIPVEKGWVNLLQNKLGDDFKIINGSISGETTQGGLSRLPNALNTHKPDLIILELGANDGLRGIPPQITKNNLKNMIELTRLSQAKVMLLGMKIPTNYGVAFSEKFEEQFVVLAKNYKLSFVPFFLEKLIGDMNYFQADQLHPTAEAQPLILESILPTFLDAIKEINIGSDMNSETKKSIQSIKNPA